jgi:hypothetical protein
MKSKLAILLLFAALCWGAPAHAFTESGGGSYAYPDGTSRFSDPDEQLDESASGGNSPVNTLKFGMPAPAQAAGGALRFGLQQPGSGPIDNPDPRSALAH